MSFNSFRKLRTSKGHNQQTKRLSSEVCRRLPIAYALILYVGKELREIIEKFAFEQNLDPSLPSTWYYLINDCKDLVFPNVLVILSTLQLIDQLALEATKKPF